MQADEFGFAETHLRCDFVFAEERGVKHCGVVSGEDYRDAMAEQLRQGVLLERCGRIMQLQGEGACAQIAGGANLEGNAALREEVHECWIVDGGDAVADALDAQNLDSFANLLWPAHLARMHKQAHPAALGAQIGIAEFVSGDAQFVAANPKGYDARRGATTRRFHNIERQLRPKLAHGIENPVEA